MVVEEEASYDAALLEKEDFIKVQAGESLLNDCVFIGGDIKVVDST